MRIVVTGSAGHLGEALVHTLRDEGHDVLGLDVLPSPTTDRTGSVTDRALLAETFTGADAVLHAATLHKPHVATHPRAAFVETNVQGTLAVLEQAVEAGVTRVVFTSTTSAFGRALTPARGEPATWVTEDLVPRPRNIYGATKVAAEDLCELVHRDHGLPIVVLRTSRFFPEADDDPAARAAFDDTNLKVNELLHRRVDLADAVSAHLRALERAEAIGFGRYIVTATTPFTAGDREELARDAPGVLHRLAPEAAAAYERLGWQLPRTIERVYSNDRARRDLGWEPIRDFAWALGRAEQGEQPFSELALAIGAKGYHRGAGG